MSSSQDSLVKLLKIVAGLALLVFSVVVLVIGFMVGQGEKDVIRSVCILAALLATPGILLVVWAGFSGRALLAVGIVIAVLMGLFAISC